MPICRANQRGAAMVEGALVLIVFVMLCLAVVDFGQFLFVNQAITERVRWAARQGAVGRLNNAEMVNTIVFGQKTAPVGKLTGAYGLAASNVAVQTLDSTTTGKRLELTVSNLEYVRFTPLLGPRGKNMRIRVVMPLETP